MQPTFQTNSFPIACFEVICEGTYKDRYGSIRKFCIFQDSDGKYDWVTALPCREFEFEHGAYASYAGCFASMRDILGFGGVTDIRITVRYD